ncbi:hypothetical protein BURK2_01038 [Burkholderiales bacterium]|nr:MAG: hypothetical protein F9K47_08260 [Burkholderiales bacterium]CAG0966703.1 hypothetical protein BURK2_01038 [Burkholderiales bacterium]
MQEGRPMREVDASFRVYEDSSDIAPFWQQMPSFFAYPFHWTSGLVIGVCMGLALFTQFTGFGFLLMSLASVAYVRFGYLVLEHTAHGHLTPDGLWGGESSADSPWRPYKQWFILALIFGLCSVAGYHLGWTLGFLLYVICMFALPASMMSLGVNGSLRESIDPRVLWFIISQLGGAYLLLGFFLLLLSASSWAVFALIVKWIPEILGVPVFVGLETYFGLVTFHLMGYVLYQYHDRLGLDVRSRSEAKQPTEQELISKALDENRVQDALGLAYEAQRTRPDDLDAIERYFKLLLLAKQPEKALNQAQRLIPLLLAKQRGLRALECYLAAREVSTEFRMVRAGDQLALARTAALERKDLLVMKLLLQFDRVYAGAAEVPTAWLLQARTMSERLKQDEAAMQLLRLLRGKYPKAPEAEEAKRLYTALKNIHQH